MDEFDLNWDEIEDFGGIPDLNYDLVWDGSDEDEDEAGIHEKGFDGGEDPIDGGESDDSLFFSNVLPIETTSNVDYLPGAEQHDADEIHDSNLAPTDGVENETGVPLRVVQHIWKKGQLGGGVHAVCSKRARNCGRKRILFNPEAIQDVPLSKRNAIRDLASALNVSKSTLFRRLKEGKFRRHTNDIKFTLTDDNKKSRVRFCISMLYSQSIPHEPTFRGSYDIVYIDEKWFYRTRKNKNYYLALDEDRPQRTVKSKNFIEKVMFLAAITRPRFDAQGNTTFSGKIGIFPFTYVEPAKRTSANRSAGSFEV